MSEYEPTEKEFLDVIKDHVMTVIRDEGIDRHVRFKRPDSSCYYFDLITWKGYLCMTGDMGTWVFSRIDDMFYFFTNGKEDSDELRINPCYWAGKVQSESMFGGGVKEFSVDRYHECVKSDFDEYTDEMDKKEKEELWKDIEWQLKGEDEYDCVEKMRNFSHDKIIFDDFWSHSIHKYTSQYIWGCYAIVWGIKKYKAERDKISPRPVLTEGSTKGGAGMVKR